MLTGSDFYGDNTRWFVARVVNSRDPEARGRVKISIKGIHSELQKDIPVIALPWAHTMVPTTEGGSSGLGKFAQLVDNALVFGVFLDGKNSQLPLVLGSLNQIEKPTTAQDYRPDNSYYSESGNKQSPIQNNPDGSINGTNNLDEDGNPLAPNEAQVSDNGIVLSTATISTGDVNPTKDSRRWSSMNFFTENGFTPAQAAGITGTLETESGFNPTIVHKKTSADDTEKSQGIAQWNPDAFAGGGRLRQLKNFASYTNRDWRVFTTQLMFIMHELKGKSLGKNDAASEYSTAYIQLKRATQFTGGQPPVGQEQFSNNATYIFHRKHSGGGYPPRSWIAASLHIREANATKAWKEFTNSPRS